MKPRYLMLVFAVLFLVMGGFMMFRQPDLTVRGDTLAQVWVFLGVLSAGVFATGQEQARRIRALEEQLAALQGRQR